MHGPSQECRTSGGSVCRVGDRNDLVEGLVRANHAEIGSRAFLGRFQALLEIDHFGIERLIAIAQRLVLLSLLGYSGAQVSRLAETLGREPQLRLQGQRDDPEYHEQPA